MCQASILAASGKNLLQRFEGCSQNCGANVAQSFDQPDLVQRAELIQQNEAALSLKSYGDSKRRRPGSSGHGSVNHGGQLVAHFRWRYDQARAGFMDLTAHGGVERDQPDFSSGYH